LLNVLLQIANKLGLSKKKSTLKKEELYFEDLEHIFREEHCDITGWNLEVNVDSTQCSVQCMPFTIWFLLLRRTNQR
jgi:hypothetical protein